jgi:DNA-binding response OmpR family regulator
MLPQERTYAMVEMKAETNRQILVVEDETEIRELMVMLLLRQGYRVQPCASAVEAKHFLAQNQYDLIILDWMLPEMSGVELLAELRRSQASAQASVPVLMVTAKAEPDDIVQGLETGADDYMTKPFEPAVLTARLKALLRRSPAPGAQKILSMGALTLNTETYEVRCGNDPLHFTPSEFKIMVTMAENKGRVLTRDQLIQVVQGEGISVTGRTIDTHVFGLRKKLGACSEVIETIRGVGYRIKMDS